MKKISGWKTKGMNRDLSVSAFNPEFAFENMNLRLSTNEGNTLMSWVNEKGTLSIGLDGSNNVSVLRGTPIGTAVINHKLIVFTTESQRDEDSTDYIYKLVFSNSGKTKMSAYQLYSGPLGFRHDRPIETLVSYEGSHIEKVYWTDGINQPRVINIAKDYNDKPSWIFNFIPELQLNEEVSVEKIVGGGGMFASGVIQYCFTYYNKYAQESNIFYTTPLHYISPIDRGGAPDEKIDNVFRITVTGIDNNYDYLRIYSIQRTSLDGTPFCRRVQDIALHDSSSNPLSSISYTDTGTEGDSIDPMELLYKGGEEVAVQTMEQKDGTLFMGNLRIKRNLLSGVAPEATEYSQTTRTIHIPNATDGGYAYGNQLTCVKVVNGVTTREDTPCAGFKKGNLYRFGIQFQHKTGKWSEPFVANNDYAITNSPSYNPTTKMLTLPSFHLDWKVPADLRSLGYRKARPVMVVAKPQNRTVICQGVACPTLYTVPNQRNGIHNLSSWFFRPHNGNESVDPSDPIPHNSYYNDTTTGGVVRVSPFAPYDSNSNFLPVLQHNSTRWLTEEGHLNYPMSVEVEGSLDNDMYHIDYDIQTLHSPDIEFDESTWSTNYLNLEYQQVGCVQFDYTLSDIHIQTETPTISSKGGGFIHRAVQGEGPYGIVSGLFYDDCIVTYDTNTINDFYAAAAKPESVKWMVYTWQSDGSLNNDIQRPKDQGVRSSMLSKKIISNLRYTTSDFDPDKYVRSETGTSVELFSSAETEMIKVNGETYLGNIDTMVIPNDWDGKYFKSNGSEATSWWKTYFRDKTDHDTYPMPAQAYQWNSGSSSTPPAWEGKFDLGDGYTDLAVKKNPVRIKYRSTPHLVFTTFGVSSFAYTEDKFSLPIVELHRSNGSFGTRTVDALREHTWIPCGEPVNITGLTAVNNNITVQLDYIYGDTYYQRYDCLKTYPFTTEDVNQVVEIGSFMLESYTNIDGRYDRNRGQLSNLYMSPRNFNLLNPVYSQKDNFFNYKILPHDNNEKQVFPNQICYSKTKQSGADIDSWTNVTLASILELDGDKGRITSLQKLNDHLICFQDTGISQILYNEQTQISTTEGVPIEIGNSGKVQGKKYFSDTVGCSNKWSIAQTPVGIYFMDSNDKSIYLFDGQLKNLSSSLGFNSWCKYFIPSSDVRWIPSIFNNFVSFYDRQNQDVLFINRETALAYSERLGVFTSFYDYGSTPFFVNLDDIGIWLRQGIEQSSTTDTFIKTELWKHQAGNYCSFFNENKPYWTVLIGNPEPQADKIFTNLEFRACVDGEGQLIDNRYQPFLPFDSLETWNEYQHGVGYLKNMKGSSQFMHHKTDNESSLKRKFRIWRCDIPRDNATDVDVFDTTFDNTFHPSRTTHPLDRMRNPWLYLKLKKERAGNATLPMVEVHDVLMTYYS